MSAVQFSYGEAIDHGWKQTKKYFEVVAVVMLVYLAVNIVSGVLDYFSGENMIQRSEVAAIFQDSTKADLFYQYLQDAGYIDPMGRTQDALNQLTSKEALVPLPEQISYKQHEVYNFLKKKSYRLPFPKPVFYGMQVILWLFSVLIGIGWIKIFLMIARDQKPAVSELFSNGRLMLPYILASICNGALVFIGIMLLIVPGIILALMFIFYSYLVVDKGCSPVESLRRSRAITKGNRFRLFVFGILLAFLNLAGALCLLVGLLVTIPISTVAWSYVYDKLENSETADLNENEESSPDFSS